MSKFCEQVETEAILHTSGSTPTLGCIALGDVGLHQAAALSLLIESDIDSVTEDHETVISLTSFRDVYHCR